jgi:hypothetical protein
MERFSVTSSNVASIGYDPVTATLEVEFNNGGIYQYFDVPETIFIEFINADSKGKYLNSMIKGSFRYAKVA